MEATCSFLFVYGTLMRGGLRQDLMAEAGVRLLAEGTIQGRLYDLGQYPGAKPSTNSDDLVRGEVHRLIDPARALAILDRYEGCFPGLPARSEFVRGVVRVTLNEGGQRPAWAYFYNRPVDESRRIPSGDYRHAAVASRT